MEQEVLNLKEMSHGELCDLHFNLTGKNWPRNKSTEALRKALKKLDYTNLPAKPSVVSRVAHVVVAPVVWPVAMAFKGLGAIARLARRATSYVGAVVMDASESIARRIPALRHLPEAVQATFAGYWIAAVIGGVLILPMAPVMGVGLILTGPIGLLALITLTNPATLIGMLIAPFVLALVLPAIYHALAALDELQLKAQPAGE